MANLDEILAKSGNAPKKVASGWNVECPVHDDRHNSLTVTEAEGTILLNCKAGCDSAQIVKAWGFEWSDLFSRNGKDPLPVATPDNRPSIWHIKDSEGNLIAEHLRWDSTDGKRFQWRANGEYGLHGLKVAELPLYRSECIPNLRPSQIVMITEGEKATDALTSLGIESLATVTGASSAPNPSVLSGLRDFERIYLWPDADKPGREHMKRVGETLTELGCDPMVIQWQSAPPKADAHDFTAAGHGKDQVGDLIQAAVPFGEWRWDLAEIVESIAMPEHDDDPDVSYTDMGGLEITWSDELVSYRVTLERIESRKDGVHAIIHGQRKYPGEDGWRMLMSRARINLYSVSARDKFRAALTGRTKLDWTHRVDQIVGAAETAIRVGDAPVVLADEADTPDVMWLLHPLIEKDEHSIIFASGGSAKSLIALALSMSVSDMSSVVSGVTPEREARGLYLDWETNSRTHRRRMGMIANGLARSMSRSIFYQRMTGTIFDSAEILRDYIRAERIGFVVVDSIGMAVGGSLMDDALANQYNGVIRAFETAGATVLSIGHVPKDKENQEAPFGSIWYTNGARSTWKAIADQQPGENSMRVALRHSKVNNTSKLPDVGLRIDFTETAIRFYREDVANIAEAEKGLPPKWRIKAILKSGEMSPKAMHEEMSDIPYNTVYKTLQRAKFDHCENCKGQAMFIQRGENWGNVKVTCQTVSSDMSKSQGDMTKTPPMGESRLVKSDYPGSESDKQEEEETEGW